MQEERCRSERGRGSDVRWDGGRMAGWREEGCSSRRWGGREDAQCNAMRCSAVRCLLRTRLLPLPQPELPLWMASGPVEEGGSGKRKSCCGVSLFGKIWLLLRPGSQGVKSVRASPAGLGTASGGSPLMTQDTDVTPVDGHYTHTQKPKTSKLASSWLLDPRKF